MNRMNLIILMDRLEDLIQSAAMIPFSGKGLVDVEEVMGLLEKIRAAIPDEIRQAEAISGERDRFLEESRAQAERIILQAEEYAAAWLPTARLVVKIPRRGKAHHSRSLGASRGNWSKMRKNMPVTVLGNLQKALERTLQVVERDDGKLTILSVPRLPETKPHHSSPLPKPNRHTDEQEDAHHLEKKPRRREEPDGGGDLRAYGEHAGKDRHGYLHHLLPGTHEKHGRNAGQHPVEQAGHDVRKEPNVGAVDHAGYLV